MSDDEKTRPLHPETNFLPPLDMVLTFFNKIRKKNQQQRSVDEQHKTEEKNVEKLIEKLSEKEE